MVGVEGRSLGKIKQLNIMKKLLAVSTILLLTSFKPNADNQYVVKADLKTWEQVLRVIDYSTVPPEQRIAVRDFIISQLNDTTINKK